MHYLKILSTYTFILLLSLGDYPIYSNNQGNNHLAMSQYFDSEESLRPGDIAGIDLKTGKIRPYMIGDRLIGIAYETDGNTMKMEGEQNAKQALIGLLGQLPFNREQVDIQSSKVFTKDGKLIGSLLANGNIFINISSSIESEPLLKKIKILRTLLKAEQLKNELQTKLIEDLNNRIKKLSR